MSSPSGVRARADQFHAEWLAFHPLSATALGLPGHDDRLPDDSPAGDRRRRAWAHQALAAAEQAPTGDPADRVTRGCLAEAAAAEIADIDSAALDHTVTAMPFSGPAELLAITARTLLPDPDSAGHYLNRLEAAGTWLDQQCERLQAGADAGRLPVASLVGSAIAWVDGVLAEPVPAALAAPTAPAGWDGAARFEADRARVVRSVVVPGLFRWGALLRELLGRARPDTEVGLVHLPGGEADYARAIRVHTTLALTADSLHATGLAEVEALEERMRVLGARLGLSDLGAVHDAMHAFRRDPHDAVAAALTAVRRAEARAAEVFPAPLPQPCEVTPMPDVVAQSGIAPHYTPPRLDGGRPGTFWFNTVRPTAGAGWDLEGVAFHEAVPGHHLQLSRLQLLTDLPALQRQRPVTAFAEGWGLYAEQLADEMGLYSSTEAQIGALAAGLMRAARLVVDTGLHAYGWSRAKALAYFTAHVPMPEAFLADEVDRYIVMPGQALAYLTGKLELLRLRDAARARLGAAFTLPAFHAAVLDAGSLPLPVLAERLTAWDGG